MMKIVVQLLMLSVAMLSLFGCSQFGNQSPYGIREFDLTDSKAGINVTDASRRIAVIYPDGSICSEGSPAAMVSRATSLSNSVSAKNSAFEASQSGGYNASSDSAKLSAQSERIQCLNISLFHACGLQAMTDIDNNKVFDLYIKLVESCATWVEPPKQPTLKEMERVLNLGSASKNAK